MGRLSGQHLFAVQGIVAALAVVMIVIGGIIYITSAGDSGRVTLAKNAIWAAVIGLALAVAAPSFLKEIYNILRQDPNNAQVDNAISLTEVALNLLQVLLNIVGALAVLMMVIGGIIYITSAGDGTRIDTAKNIIKYSVIGLVFALVSLVIVTQIANIFA